MIAETKQIRINMELVKRLEQKKKTWESWSAFLNRMIPEDDAR